MLEEGETEGGGGREATQHVELRWTAALQGLSLHIAIHDAG